MNRRRVLIETSWNVKREEATDEMVRFAVLIETSWNVKTTVGSTLPYAGFRINRNIVECKVNQQLHELIQFVTY